MKITRLNDAALEQAQKLAETFGMFSDGDDEPVAVGAWQDDRLIGVCMGRLGRTSGTAELMFVHVNGLFRGRGIARDMVEVWKQGAQREGMRRLAVEFIVENGQSNPRAFLEALGFSGLRQCETLFSARLAVLAGSEWAQPPKKVTQPFVRLSELSQPDFSRLRIAMQHSLPRYAVPQSVQGELLRELSWVLWDEKGAVRLSLLFSEEDDVLYLHSLYCEKGWHKYIPELLHLSLSHACAQSDRYERIYVTCINDSTRRLVQRIAQGLPYQQRTAWRMYLQIQ